ncbi:hypothetical protein E5K00_09550 [Hymenobacter aquaticus]|uniref:Uncharacterized protein n=1 Tax=Hymenobacter aquaticus TaxID=1867101 RepID=A0A4Z0Q8B2_9BACT|nr:hypothetical protein [Hymenobacter aquaticus]TGE25413.1 hypothetical protein E5K00_09550 [Hymenobacter aquaticus]
MTSTLFRTTLALLTTGLSVLTSCSKDQAIPSAPATPAATATAAANYSGEALFQGIFLLQGPAAADIPYFDVQRSAIAKDNQQHPRHAQERQAAARHMTALVRLLDPGYFQELQTAIASQNFASIEAALRKGAALHYSAVRQVVPAAALVASGQHQQAAGQKLDLTRYDFTKQTELERYISDAAHTGSREVAAELEQPLLLDGYVIVHAAMQYPGSNVIDYFVTEQNRPGGSELAKAMRQRATLETDKLVRDLAFLSRRG